MKKSSLIEILPAKKRGFFLKVDGKPLISEFDPILEGERIANLYQKSNTPVCFIFLGILPFYHIEYILRRFTQDSLVWIFEENDLIRSIFPCFMQSNFELLPNLLSRIQKKKYL